MIKYGVNQWSYPDNISLIEMIKHASKTGYKGFEPAITLDDLSMSNSEFKTKWKKLGELLDEYGLKAPSNATTLYWRIEWFNESEFNKIEKIITRQLEAAEILGSSTILVVPGKAVPDISYDQLIGKTVEILLKLKPLLAKHKGIIIGLENVWNKYLAGPLEYRFLLEKLDREYYGLYLDVGNTLPHSLPEHWITLLKEWIIQIHVKDYSIAEKRFGIPLTGDVNWHNIRELLSMINYNGFLVAEIPPYKGDPFKAVEDTFTSLKKIFGE